VVKIQLLCWRLKKKQLATISSKFQFTINEIRQMELAEMNQELFDKLFGEGVISSEKELKERLAKDLEKMFENDSDRMLTNKVYEALLKKQTLNYHQTS
jgi:trigger factor